VPWSFSLAIYGGPYHLIRDILPPVTAALLGISNVIGFDLPPVGPWWFIPFIMQLYALWFVLRWVAKRFGRVGLLLVAGLGLAFTYGLNPLLAHRTINLLTTPIGRLPTICFGIYAARSSVRITHVTAAAGFAALVLGSMYSAVFPFAPLGILLVMLWAYVRFRNVLRGSSILLRIGECSLLIFLLNGVVRNRLVEYATTPERQLYWGFLSAGLSLAICNLIARLLEPTPAPAMTTARKLPAVSKA